MQQLWNTSFSMSEQENSQDKANLSNPYDHKVNFLRRKRTASEREGDGDETDEQGGDLENHQPPSKRPNLFDFSTHSHSNAETTTQPSLQSEHELPPPSLTNSYQEINRFLRDLHLEKLNRNK
eukprot:TRINITY_DN1945_c0_g1_i2.p1 TRINITY_DN1945_c0_g1~~TRINITY_DN1945_c0_g1_i2.p1  ORF type:complete len:123 (+),score=23.43 TRINITY_DN1945_c0_g1_i2:279-647(+)